MSKLVLVLLLLSPVMSWADDSCQNQTCASTSNESDDRNASQVRVDNCDLYDPNEVVPGPLEPEPSPTKAESAK